VLSVPPLPFFHLELCARGDLADFCVFDDAAAKAFHRGLEHGAAKVVAVDVEAGERLEEAAEGIEKGVEFGLRGGGLGVDERRVSTTLRHMLTEFSEFFHVT
jgi:hypothetical protein